MRLLCFTRVVAVCTFVAGNIQTWNIIEWWTLTIDTRRKEPINKSRFQENKSSPFTSLFRSYNILAFTVIYFFDRPSPEIPPSVFPLSQSHRWPSRIITITRHTWTRRSSKKASKKSLIDYVRDLLTPKRSSRARGLRISSAKGTTRGRDKWNRKEKGSRVSSCEIKRYRSVYAPKNLNSKRNSGR